MSGDVNDDQWQLRQGNVNGCDDIKRAHVTCEEAYSCTHMKDMKPARSAKAR